MTPPRLYHGGVPGLQPGDFLLPAALTSYWYDGLPDRVLTNPDRVYLTTEPEIAFAYAALRAMRWHWPYGAVYAAVPAGGASDTEPDPDMSWCCVRCQLAEVTEVLDPAAEPTAEMIVAAWRYIPLDIASSAGQAYERYRGMPHLRAHLERLIAARPVDHRAPETVIVRTPGPCPAWPGAA